MVVLPCDAKLLKLLNDTNNALELWVATSAHDCGVLGCALSPSRFAHNDLCISNKR
jgi:hypothetical protein